MRNCLRELIKLWLPEHLRIETGEVARSRCLATWKWRRPQKQTVTPSILRRGPLAEKLGYEKDLLGFYVTGHPLDPYREIIEGGEYVAVSDLANQEDKVTVKIAGSISAFDKKHTRKEGKPFAILTVEDFTGSVEVMVWNEVFAKAAKGNR